MIHEVPAIGENEDGFIGFFFDEPADPTRSVEPSAANTTTRVDATLSDDTNRTTSPPPPPPPVANPPAAVNGSRDFNLVCGGFSGGVLVCFTAGFVYSRYFQR